MEAIAPLFGKIIFLKPALQKPALLKPKAPNVQQALLDVKGAVVEAVEATSKLKQPIAISEPLLETISEVEG